MRRRFCRALRVARTAAELAWLLAAFGLLSVVAREQVGPFAGIGRRGRA